VGVALARQEGPEWFPSGGLMTRQGEDRQPGHAVGSDSDPTDSSTDGGDAE